MGRRTNKVVVCYINLTKPSFVLVINGKTNLTKISEVSPIDTV